MQNVTNQGHNITSRLKQRSKMSNQGSGFQGLGGTPLPELI